MRLLRTVVIATALVAVPAASLAVAAGPAAAHEHPTQVELVSPAVVRVETYAEVSISLIEHGLRGEHIGLHQRTYTPLLAAGSGFAVNPTGGIVTSREVTDVDLKRAEVYAANQIFHEQYGGQAAPLPADPFTKHRIPGGSPANRIAERLQQCYTPNRTDSSGGCVIFTKRLVRVLPFVSSQKDFGNLEATVLAPKAGQPGDVVVLKVGASSMPTVRLGTSVKGTAFTVLGFTTVPSNGQSLRTPIGHFVQDGSTEVKRDEWYPAIVAGMGSGIAGGPLVGGQTGEVLGFLMRRPGGSASELTMVGPAAIKEALKAAQIEPRSGPTDAAYESALHNYKNKYYAASIPSLTQTLKLYPGHGLATEALAQANRKKGTAEDLTGRESQVAAPPANRVDWQRTVLPLAAAATALIVLALAIVLLRRRRRSPTVAAAEPGERASAGPDAHPATAVVHPPRRQDAAASDGAAFAAGRRGRLRRATCRRPGDQLPGVRHRGHTGADVLRPVRAAAGVGGRR
nr:hypothetical protein asmbl_2 [uncultured bacterium]